MTRSHARPATSRWPGDGSAGRRPAVRRLSAAAASLRDALIARVRLPRLEEVDGFLSRAEAVALYRYASRVPSGGTIVEIGTWKGRSTYCLARGLREGRVIAIDPFDASGDSGSQPLYEQQQGMEPLLAQFVRRMRRLGVLVRIDPWQGYSQDFVDSVPPIDLLFIDGDHSIERCRFDFENYAPRVRPGGYLLLHDYRPKWPEMGPTWVVRNLVLPSGRFRFLGRYGSLWVGRRTRG